MPGTQNDYVLGTHDDEIARLGLQHNAWRARVFAAWQSARIQRGQTWLDIGCGPGYASLDLAEAVGPEGQVIALDKSDRFLDALRSRSRDRNLGNITTHRVDLESSEFPIVRADRAWCRWVLCFVNSPGDVLSKIAASLKPGGTLVLHEYFDYGTWRASPACPELDEYVAAVMSSWRATGGDPDIALRLSAWLGELGFEIQHARPIVDAPEPDTLLWAWLRAFIQVGRERLVELGYLTRCRADDIWNAFLAFESSHSPIMITPGVLEIVAQRAIP
jgi:ubiquinone/menaquinone biosynthesis C-methylase UbiE